MSNVEFIVYLIYCDWWGFVKQKVILKCALLRGIRGLPELSAWRSDGRGKSIRAVSYRTAIDLFYLFIFGGRDKRFMRVFDLPEEYKTAVWWGFFFIIIIYLFYFKAPFLFLSIGQGQIRSTVLIYNKRIFSLR